MGHRRFARHPGHLRGIDQHLYGFLSVSLHPDVKNAFHAMALDEQRQQFPATLWQGPYAADQHVEQVWFAGVHCDVGGGYSQPPPITVPGWPTSRSDG